MVLSVTKHRESSIKLDSVLPEHIKKARSITGLTITKILYNKSNYSSSGFSMMVLLFILVLY